MNSTGNKSMIKTFHFQWIPLVLAAGFVCGCSSPQYRITGLSWSSDISKVNESEAPILAVRVISYSAARVRGELIEGGWVFKRLALRRRSFLGRNPEFELVPKFDRRQGAPPTEFVGYYTFGFTDLSGDMNPRVSAGDHQLESLYHGGFQEDPFKFK